ncbi:excisionase family DNA-binding protein [Actinotignum sanguinis]|uniref:excisionase family DNA-binding protein n=1 Tax=Actinotignum sanguinis TaxID=1445614 RepID=UPI00254FF0D6|nr:excisionase family DNA-binding protein [Actinotignum sanguinis]MDK8656354.1 excisionase family DNA-binding protein [Actinotignum sanguinis]
MKQILTLQEAVAEGYGGYSTLRSWIKCGWLPAYKTGRRYRVRREDLEKIPDMFRALDERQGSPFDDKGWLYPGDEGYVYDEGNSERK